MDQNDPKKSPQKEAGYGLCRAIETLLAGKGFKRNFITTRNQMLRKIGFRDYITKWLRNHREREY